MATSDASADVLPLVRSDGTRLTLREIEASAIDHAILTCRNASQVARELGIGRSTLYRKVRELYGAHIPAQREQATPNDPVSGRRFTSSQA